MKQAGSVERMEDMRNAFTIKLGVQNLSNKAGGVEIEVTREIIRIYNISSPVLHLASHSFDMWLDYATVINNNNNGRICIKAQTRR
jgi:hypothetical protein